MQALNFQLDMNLSKAAMHKGFSTSVQGSNLSFQDGTSFRQMLEKARGEKTRDGISTQNKDYSQKDVFKAEENFSSRIHEAENEVEKSSDLAEKPKSACDDEKTVAANDNSEKKSEVAKVAEEKSGISKENGKTVSKNELEGNSDEVASLENLETEIELSEKTGKINGDEILLAVMTGQSISQNDEKLTVEEGVSINGSLNRLGKKCKLGNLEGNEESLIGDDSLLSKDMLKVDLEEDLSVEKNIQGESGNLDLKLKAENNEKNSVLTVIDQRKNAENDIESIQGNFGAKDGVASSVVEKADGSEIISSDDMVFTYQSVGNNNVNVDVNLKNANTVAAKDFAQMLSQELQNNAGELVKSGTMILKDGGKGSINLILHPESLGSVKIKLELSENVVEGKIIVYSEEAYKAFKESIGALKNAFAESGFQNSGFDLSFAGQNNDGNTGESKNPNWKDFENHQFGYYEDENGIILGDGSINSNDFYRDSRYSVLV